MDRPALRQSLMPNHEVLISTHPIQKCLNCSEQNTPPRNQELKKLTPKAMRTQVNGPISSFARGAVCG
jgi:hypothetical protein